MYALTAIPGMGRRISNVVCKKAEVDMRKRAGDLSADEIERIVSIVSDPKKFKVRAGPRGGAETTTPLLSSGGAA
jgi:small subunit ribosomal protein S18e